jgi:hypothetical protein
MTMKKINIVKFVFFLIVLIIWSYTLTFFGPDTIVESLGVRNALLLLFIVGALGGVSTLTATLFYTKLFTLALAGINPFVLGVVGGFAITIGDSLFFYLGHSGRSLFRGKLKKWSEYISNHFIDKCSPRSIFLFTFAYTGLTPLPNDVLTVTLGLAGIKYSRVIGAILLGNIFLTILLAYFAVFI